MKSYGKFNDSINSLNPLVAAMPCDEFQESVHPLFRRERPVECPLRFFGFSEGAALVDLIMKRPGYPGTPAAQAPAAR